MISQLFNVVIARAASIFGVLLDDIFSVIVSCFCDNGFNVLLDGNDDDFDDNKEEEEEEDEDDDDEEEEEEEDNDDDDRSGICGSENEVCNEGIDLMSPSWKYFN